MEITKIGQWAMVTGRLIYLRSQEALFEGGKFQMGPKLQEGATTQQRRGGALEGDRKALSWQ